MCKIDLRAMATALSMLLALSTLATVPALAQTGSTVTPEPPAQVCANGQCAYTSIAVTSSGNGSPSTARIKWNPGHYMGSNTVLYAGSQMSAVQSEMDDINNQDGILGYRAFVTWGALEPSQGTYDFSVLDQIMARLKTQYNKPKRLAIVLWLYGQHSLQSHDNSVFPLYLQQSAIYGSSPVSNSYGWWGESSGGTSTGMYAPALYYSSVMDRLIALVQAIGQHYDNEAMFDFISFNEDATITQAAADQSSVDPHYSDANWLQQIERLLTASTAAFPHTNVVMNNTWFTRPAAAVTLEQWMAANRIMAGTPDTWGQSALTAFGTTHLSDGMQTLFGTDANGGNVDLRQQMASVVEVQMPDIIGNYFAKYNGPWAPLDITNAVNQTYKASYVIWTHLFGTENFYGAATPVAAKWNNLAATVTANPVTHTAYPPNYP